MFGAKTLLGQLQVTWSRSQHKSFFTRGPKFLSADLTNMIFGCPLSCDLGVLPLCFAIILVVSLATSFTIAVYDSDITPWFPAISDTATKSPESNILGQLLDIASFIGLILAYVRYLQVKRDIADHIYQSRAIVILNRWSLLFGLTANLGSSIVANFPVRNHTLLFFLVLSSDNPTCTVGV